MGNSSTIFITTIICYNKNWVRQDIFYSIQAERNICKNTEVLLSGFFQQFIERSHMAGNIPNTLQIDPFPPPPTPSFDKPVSKCYSNSIVEHTLLWNSTIQFSTFAGVAWPLLVLSSEFLLWTCHGGKHP